MDEFLEKLNEEIEKGATITHDDKDDMLNDQSTACSSDGGWGDGSIIDPTLAPIVISISWVIAPRECRFEVVGDRVFLIGVLIGGPSRGKEPLGNT